MRSCKGRLEDTNKDLGLSIDILSLSRCALEIESSKFTRLDEAADERAERIVLCGVEAESCE